MDSPSSPEVFPQQRVPLEVVFRSSKMMDQIVRKMARKPQTIENYKRIFLTSPELPPGLFQQKVSFSESLPRLKTPRAYKEDKELLPIPESEMVQYSKPATNPILTPTWGCDSPFSANAKASDAPSNSTDFTKIHQPIEVMESRIFTEVDRQHFHTGQILDISQTDPPKEITEIEKKKLQNYFIHDIPNKVPAQWERRVWDAPENIMDEEDSLELYSKIQHVKEMAADINNWSIGGKHKRKHRPVTKAIPRAESEMITVLRPRINRTRKAAVTLTTICFATDESDDITDWEDFEF